MITYQHLIHILANSELERLTENLEALCAERLSLSRYGDLPGWLEALDAIPNINGNHSGYYDLRQGLHIGKPEDISAAHKRTLDAALRALIPWRKGPFDLFGLYIDTEWRSDWKWDRVRPHLKSLQGKEVLDVGCGNGYHCWRMYGAGAQRVIGIDPSPRFIVQFEMIKKCFRQVLPANVLPPVDVLPLGIDDLPHKLHGFDTTFSMGVLYHRRSPMDHLIQLKETLKEGGQLILETLTVNGDENTVLVPPNRYAMMNNVWFLPSPLALERWLKKCGFKHVHCVDLNTTDLKEQRRTEWMKFHSLEQFLNTEDPSLTAEGHPAPQRAIFIAET